MELGVSAQRDQGAIPLSLFMAATALRGTFTAVHFHWVKEKLKFAQTELKEIQNKQKTTDAAPACNFSTTKFILSEII